MADDVIFPSAFKMRRDLYDIHTFYLRGIQYNKKVITERTKMKTNDKITDTIIHKDLNYLLERQKFQAIRKTLKIETLHFISEVISLWNRIGKNISFFFKTHLL